jgi:hypothetical protein
MHLLTLDFESYWSTTHSLSKMDPISYVMHPDTEIISCSAKVNDGQTIVVFGEDEVRRLLVDCKVEDSLTIAHNASGFDALILAWRLKLKPRMWGCTLSMARPHHGRVLPKLSLAALVKFHGIGEKNDAILVQTKGKHLADFTPDEIARMRIYNGEDTEQCHGLFKIYRPLTSNREMWTIDSCIRMMVDDVFELDTGIMREALKREKAKKRKTLLALADMLGVACEDPDEAAELVKSELMSTPKFKALLESLGVEVPMKPSPKDEDRMIPALAKTDPGLTELLEADNEIVAAAAAARLQMKSTLLETRIESFLCVHTARGGTLPIPAKYWGAHTGRDSGDLYNALNLPRIVRDKNDKIIPKITNALRLGVRAPKDKVVMAADLSGIEMRVNHFLWKVKYSTDRWRADAKADIYRPTAAHYYGIEESAVTGAQRQFGKVLQLACGFQVGPPKFKAFAWGQFRLSLSDEEAEAGVYGWRDMTPEIADRRDGGWAKCQRALDYIIAGQEMPIDPWGLVHTAPGGIVLPDGNMLRYHDLRQVVDEKNGRTAYKYGRGRHTKYVYGGSVDENIVQALARIILMDNVMEFWRRTGLRPALRVYDEAVYVVDENEYEGLLEELLSIMRTPPKWWRELVVWSEGDAAEAYGLAK